MLFRAVRNRMRNRIAGLERHPAKDRPVGWPVGSVFGLAGVAMLAYAAWPDSAWWSGVAVTVSGTKEAAKRATAISRRGRSVCPGT